MKQNIFKDLSIYKNKRVLITGHTGFKGSWLTIWLLELGAEIIGISNEEHDTEGIFQQAKLKEKIKHIIADVTDLSMMKLIFDLYRPEIIFHLAAQPLVLKSYEQPQETFNSNVMGTVNLLECIRTSPSVKAAIMITSDKCYKNKEWIYGYRENDELGGTDPYSASKSCAEIVINSYSESFLKKNISIASTRAGNVIGGGDWSLNRIVPDVIKALEKNEKIILRNPTYVRPWQHVLEPLEGYLLLGSKLYSDKKYSGAWNFGPSQDTYFTVQELVENLIELWGSGSWQEQKEESPKETKLLSLDSRKAQLELNWESKLNFKDTTILVIEWYKQYKTEDVYTLCKRQIDFYSNFQHEQTNIDKMEKIEINSKII